jgi:hypothetical protein
MAPPLDAASVQAPVEQVADPQAAVADRQLHLSGDRRAPCIADEGGTRPAEPTRHVTLPSTTDKTVSTNH